MIENITVQHVTFVTRIAFDEVVRRFEEQVGSLEKTGWSSIPDAARDKADFERRVGEKLGPSGFTRFLTIDHGQWVTAMHDRPTRFIQYTLGNPFIAITMIRHHVEAGLDVPVRMAIYEHDDGTTRLVFNTASSLMGTLGAQVKEAALKLDAKMMALGESVTGVKA